MCARSLVQRAAISSCGTVVERATLEEVVRDNKKRVQGCGMLLLTLLFFLLFTTSVVLHEDISEGHLLQSPMRDALAEPLQGVDTVRDFWRWLDETFIPIFFQQTDMHGEQLPPQEWSRVLQYSQLQGAAMLEQARSARGPCPNSLVAHTTCYPQEEPSAEPFGWPVSALGQDFNRSILSYSDEGFIPASKAQARRLRPLREELMRYLPSNNPKDATFRFMLQRGSPLTEIQQRVEYLRKRRWLDEQTAKVVIKVLVLNSEFERPRVESLHVEFYFSRGGGIFTSLRYQAVFLRSFNGYTIIADAAFVLVLLVFTLWVFVAFIRAARNGRGRAHLLKFLNLLAWLNLILSWAYVALYVYRETMRESVRAKLEELNSATTALSRFEEELHEEVDSMLVFTAWCHTLNTYMVLLLMVRVFRGLEFQPRLAVVVNTLKATSIDLFHLAIIIVPTFLAFAIAGQNIFGRRVAEFATIERAVGTCFKIAIESEFPWQELSTEDFWTAATWVGCYVLLFVLIMLNMVLAIIMDVYTAIRNQDSGQESVGESLWWMATRARLHRTWISSDVLLDTLRTLPPLVTDGQFQKAVPSMPQQQYAWLMHRAKLRAKTALTSSKADKLTRRMLIATHLSLNSSSKALNRLLVKSTARPEGADRREVRSDELCQEDVMQSMAVQNHWMLHARDQLAALRAESHGRQRVAEEVVTRESTGSVRPISMERRLKRMALRAWCMAGDAERTPDDHVCSEQDISVAVAS